MKNMIGKEITARHYKTIGRGATERQEEYTSEYRVLDEWVEGEKGKKYLAQCQSTGRTTVVSAYQIIATTSAFLALIFLFFA